jgi:TfoX/Sxy family transcriptional regulator of competence genes
MSTQSDTIDFILAKLGDYDRFTTRKMFGEYALYADGKVVALVCDDQLYIKIVPASSALADICEQDAPYPGAKPYYLVEEHQLSAIKNLSEILVEIAKALPEKKKK